MNGLFPHLLIGLVARCALDAAAQTVIFEDTFDTGIDSSLWDSVVPEPSLDAVSTDAGKLHVVNSGAGGR